MINFFVKKTYLVDSLNNFVDVHNHILPGIDDGAKTVDDSLGLLKGFEEIGIRKFIATPHIMHNLYDNDRTTINASLEKLKSSLLEQNMKDFAIEASAEHMIDDNFEALLAEGGEMSMRKDYLLVEMSYLQPPINFNEAILKTVENGYYPILAHPERYNFIGVNSSRYSSYRKQGVLFQMNMLSLGNYYDRDVQRKARKLLDEGMIDFLATDVHNQKHLSALKNITVNRRTLKQILPVISDTIETFY